MKPKAWMELSLSPSWLVCCSYVRSGHTCWWACQRKGKINPLKLNCRVILLCYPSDPHAAKPTCLVRILDIKMLLTQWFLCILAYLIHFFSSVQGKYRCFFFYLCLLFLLFQVRLWCRICHQPFRHFVKHGTTFTQMNSPTLAHGYACFYFSSPSKHTLLVLYFTLIGFFVYSGTPLPMTPSRRKVTSARFKRPTWGPSATNRCP